jgi:hypothetical protein
VLVMRENDCVISQRPTHDVEVSTSQTAPPVPDIAAAPLEQELRRAVASPAHFDEAQAEKVL